MPITTSFGRGGGVIGGGIAPSPGAALPPQLPAQQPLTQQLSTQQAPMSFGQYFRQFPLPLAILALANDPTRFLSGYVGYQQAAGEAARRTAQQEREWKEKQRGNLVDELITGVIASSPEFINADFNDPEIAEKITNTALGIARNYKIPLRSSDIKKVLDDFAPAIDPITGDPSVFKVGDDGVVTVFQKTKSGGLVRQDTGVVVDVDKLEKNAAYRVLLTKLPRVGPMIEQAILSKYPQTVDQAKREVIATLKQPKGLQKLSRQLGGMKNVNYLLRSLGISIPEGTTEDKNLQRLIRKQEALLRQIRQKWQQYGLDIDLMEYVMMDPKQREEFTRTIGVSRLQKLPLHERVALKKTLDQFDKITREIGGVPAVSKQEYIDAALIQARKEIEATGETPTREAVVGRAAEILRKYNIGL